MRLGWLTTTLLTALATSTPAMADDKNQLKEQSERWFDIVTCIMLSTNAGIVTPNLSQQKILDAGRGLFREFRRIEAQGGNDRWHFAIPEVAIAAKPYVSLDYSLGRLVEKAADRADWFTNNPSSDPRKWKGQAGAAYAELDCSLKLSDPSLANDP